MALRQELETQGSWLFRYRSFLPLIVIFIGLAVFIETNWNRSASECSPYYEIICLLISMFGLGIRIYTVGFTPKNTSGRNTKAGQVADELNTTGIYSIVRNPLYLGNFFMWFGLALFTENVWFIISFILSYWIYYERIVFAEEQFLERKFGNERETSHKDAGIRTFGAIILASCLFVAIASHLTDDKSAIARMLAAIATGLGFIGAGLSFKDKSNSLLGLTTSSAL